MCSNLRFVVTIHQFIDTGSHGKFSWKLRLETFLLCYMKRICCVSVDLQNEVVDRISNKKENIKYVNIKKIEGRFIVVERKNKEVNIPLHRIKEVSKKGVVVWKR